MAVVIFIFGILIGSFLNALIWRLHTEESIMHGRSYCPYCKHTLSWRELVPLASFIIQKGKCKHCGKKISRQYPLVELATGVLFIIAYCVLAREANGGVPAPIFPPETFIFTDYLLLLRNFFFIAVLIVIFIYDLKWYLILDKVTLPAIVTAFVWNALFGISWYTMFVGAAIAGGFFFLQFAVSHGRWIGGGDIRLGALMGVMLGWQQTLVALMISYIVGSVVGVGLLATKKKTAKSHIPFGTFLSIGTVVVLLYGEKIITWYIHLIV